MKFAFLLKFQLAFIMQVNPQVLSDQCWWKIGLLNGKTQKKMLPFSFSTVVYRPEWMRVERRHVLLSFLVFYLLNYRKYGDLIWYLAGRGRRWIFPRIHGTNVDKYLIWELHISVGSAFTLRTFPITERTTSETVNNETFISLSCKLCADTDQHHSHKKDKWKFNHKLFQEGFRL